MDNNYMDGLNSNELRNKDDNNIGNWKKEMKVYSGPNPNTSLFHIFKFASQLGSNRALNNRIQLHSIILV